MPRWPVRCAAGGCPAEAGPRKDPELKPFSCRECFLFKYHAEVVPPFTLSGLRWTA